MPEVPPVGICRPAMLLEPDWDQQVESLNQKEAEVHRRQLQLVREQQASTLERLERLEQQVGENCEKQVRELRSLKEALDKRRCESEGLRGLQALQSCLRERMDAAEQSLGELTLAQSKDATALRLAHAKHEAAVAKCSKELEALREAQEPLPERLAYLELTVAGTADKHLPRLQSLKASVERQAREVDALKAAAGAQPDRLDGLEQQLAACETQRVRELQALRTGLERQLRELEGRAVGKVTPVELEGQLSQRLEVLKLAHSQHEAELERQSQGTTALTERMDDVWDAVQALKAASAYHVDLKERLCDSAERHEKALEALRSSSVGLEERLAKDVRDLWAVQDKMQAKRNRVRDLWAVHDKIQAQAG